MTISTYAELQTSVASWLHRADLTSQIPDFITLAESKLNRKLRLRAQETTATGTVSATVAFTDFLYRYAIAHGFGRGKVLPINLRYP